MIQPDHNTVGAQTALSVLAPLCAFFQDCDLCLQLIIIQDSRSRR